MPSELKLFDRLRRVNVTWPQRDQPPFDWPDVAKQMEGERAALCIVNTKKAAKLIFDELREQTDASAFHLSTAMCPAHRLEVLDEVRRRLKAGDRCHLVSTQLIEAGVDVDFPLVMREFAPLEAIVQSAGRCNREGWMNKPDGTPGGRYKKCSLGGFRSLESANIQVWRGKYDDRVGLVPEMDDYECVV